MTVFRCRSSFCAALFWYCVVGGSSAGCSLFLAAASRKVVWVAEAFQPSHRLLSTTHTSRAPTANMAFDASSAEEEKDVDVDGGGLRHRPARPCTRRSVLQHSIALSTLVLAGVGTGTTTTRTRPVHAVDICDVIDIFDKTGEGRNPDGSHALAFKQPCFSGVWYDQQQQQRAVLIRKSKTVAQKSVSVVPRSNDTTTTARTAKTSVVKFTDAMVKVPNATERQKEVRFVNLLGKDNDDIGILSKDGTTISFENNNNSATTETWTKNSRSVVEGVYATDSRTAGQGYRVIVIAQRPGTDNLLDVQLNSEQSIMATLVNTKDTTKKTTAEGEVVQLHFDFPQDGRVTATYTPHDQTIRFPYPIQSNRKGNTVTKWDRWIKL